MAETPSMRVAIIGSGPAGFYAAMELLGNRDYDIHVDMYDRLPTPWGLVRYGVAPDHEATKRVTRLFEWCATDPNFRFYLNVEVGRDVSHAELASYYDAVIYACGASGSRALGIAGEELPGSHAASEFVAWYNGHPDYAAHEFDLSSERAVVVGNGNVALDIARVLAKRPEELGRTDIADYAIEALSKSNIKEVVVLGRRGIGEAAFTSPELLGLGDLAGVDIVVEADGDLAAPDDASTSIQSFQAGLKAQFARELSQRPNQPGNRRIVLKFLRSPVKILGESKVEGLRVVCNRLEEQTDGSIKAVSGDEFEQMSAGLVLTSVGYFGKPIPGVPFDESMGTVPNDRGRALKHAGGAPESGVYCAGWIKRGPSGVIGTNKLCSKETVRSLLDDFGAGKLSRVGNAPAPSDLLSDRGVDALNGKAWRRLNAHELDAGVGCDRPRVKVTSLAEMRSIALEPTESRDRAQS